MKTKQQEAHDARRKYLEECRVRAAELRERLKPWSVFVRTPISAIAEAKLNMVREEAAAKGKKIGPHPGVPRGIVVIWRDGDKLIVGASHLHPTDEYKFNRHEAFIKAVEKNARTLTSEYLYDLWSIPKRWDKIDVSAHSSQELATIKFIQNFPNATWATIQRMLYSIREQEAKKTAAG